LKTVIFQVVWLLVLNFLYPWRLVISLVQEEAMLFFSMSEFLTPGSNALFTVLKIVLHFLTN
jgi:hypothetical protein